MLVRLSPDGKILEGELEPTSERFMHLELYRQRPGVGGVAHGHPIFCTAFATSQQGLPENILPELIATIGQVPLVPYGRPSSPPRSHPTAANITFFCFRITAQPQLDEPFVKLINVWKSSRPIVKALPQ